METVVLLPSLGRPASDFEALCASLHSAGFATLPIDPPRFFPSEPTFHDLARYVIEVVDDAQVERFHLIGHAFGNRLSRMVTADFPERVLTLTLIAAGGYVEADPDILRSVTACFDETLPDEIRWQHVERAFFAAGNDSSVWHDGWMRDAMLLQRAALISVDRSEWWDAVAPRVLVIQALQDAIALVGNGRKYVADHPSVATLIEIEGSGHAMLPEQPEQISRAVLSFLRPTAAT